MLTNFAAHVHKMAAMRPINSVNVKKQERTRKRNAPAEATPAQLELLVVGHQMNMRPIIRTTLPPSLPRCIRNGGSKQCSSDSHWNSPPEHKQALLRLQRGHRFNILQDGDVFYIYEACKEKSPVEQLPVVDYRFLAELLDELLITVS